MAFVFFLPYRNERLARGVKGCLLLAMTFTWMLLNSSAFLLISITMDIGFKVSLGN